MGGAEAVVGLQHGQVDVHDVLHQIAPRDTPDIPRAGPVQQAEVQDPAAEVGDCRAQCSPAAHPHSLHDPGPGAVASGLPAQRRQQDHGDQQGTGQAGEFRAHREAHADTGPQAEHCLPRPLALARCRQRQDRRSQYGQNQGALQRQHPGLHQQRVVEQGGPAAEESGPGGGPELGQKQEYEDGDQAAADGGNQAQQQRIQLRQRRADVLKGLPALVAAEGQPQCRQQLAMGRVHIEKVLARAAVGIGITAKVHLVEHHRGGLAETEKMQGEACQQEGGDKYYPAGPGRCRDLIPFGLKCQ